MKNRLQNTYINAHNFCIYTECTKIVRQIQRNDSQHQEDEKFHRTWGRKTFIFHRYRVFHTNWTWANGNKSEENKNIAMKIACNVITSRKIPKKQGTQAIDDTIWTGYRSPKCGTSRLLHRRLQQKFYSLYYIGFHSESNFWVRYKRTYVISQVRYNRGQLYLESDIFIKYILDNYDLTLLINFLLKHSLYLNNDNI